VCAASAGLAGRTLRRGLFEVAVSARG